MLRFYNSSAKRDYTRFEGYDPLKMPRQKFTPWFIKRTTATNSFIKEIKLVDTDGSETDISTRFETTNQLLTGWTNGAGGNAYDTFTSSSEDLTSVIESLPSASTKWGFSNTLDFTLKVGDVFYVSLNLTLTSGTAPTLYIGDATTKAALSNTVVLTAGLNYITFKITTLGTAQLIVSNASGVETNYGIVFGNLKGSVRPHPIAKTDDYLPYFGGCLENLLPNGIYSLKVTDKYNTYYSDYFCISDLQATLPTDWTNPGTSFNTFTYDTATHDIVAIESDGGAATAESGTFTIVPDEEIYMSGCLEMTSGVTPKMGLYDDSDDSVISAAQTLDDGDNLLTFTSDRTATAHIKLTVTNDSAFSIAPTTIFRAYGDYIRMTWDNTRDIRDTAGKYDLIYSEGWSQEMFFTSPLNTPVHESNEVGQEKDGTFIAEKVTATPRQRIVDYVPRSTYEQLISLPLHDTITIWDEVGNKYLVGGAADQASGNCEVNFDFTYFEIGTLEILFTETSYYWTENITNKT